MLNLATCIKSLIMHGTESHVTVVNLCFLLSQLPTKYYDHHYFFKRGVHVHPLAPPLPTGLKTLFYNSIYFSHWWAFIRSISTGNMCSQGALNGIPVSMSNMNNGTDNRKTSALGESYSD